MIGVLFEDRGPWAGFSPMRGTASEVGGIVSATSKRNTVSDSRIVTPETQQAKVPYISFFL